jgi:hypothetical protein
MRKKKCSKCGKYKKLDYFSPHKDNGTRLQLHSWCKKCQSVENLRRYYERRKNNPEEIRMKARLWRAKSKEIISSYSKKYNSNRRLKILKHYSDGTPKCACCGETEIKFLSIDHIDGGGLKHLREIGGRGRLPAWIIKNNFPNGFQILCHNCNFAKGHYGKCPHNN